VVTDLRFEWDESKNRANRRKHGVSFEEAQSVFLDDEALLLDDPDHSLGTLALRQRSLTMRKHYDFSNARRNPYAKRLKKQVTIRLDQPTLAYFKDLGEKVGMPYQTLINMYLRDCAETRKELRLQWRPTDAA
jgi:uncharacterized DUF497 family protein